MASNRVGTATNLQPGGTYDMLLVKVEGVFPEGKVTFGLYDVPMKITGLQKVVQTFLKVLMTTRGSDVFYPTRGTRFPTLTINANLLSSNRVLESEISEAIRDAEDQTRSYLNVNTVDASSSLDSVQLLGVDAIPEGVVVYLKVVTLAGQYAAISLPFPEFGLQS